jgi:L-asparaginase / beta-aspartyl-peptidase
MLSKPPASTTEITPTRRGIGVSLLTRVKNPSSLVRALYMSPSLAPHTFLSGTTPEDLGESLGQTLVDPSYFFTEHRWREHRRGLGLPEEPLPHHDDATCLTGTLPLDQLPTGTVGAVALDVHGCIVSLTSTGGRTNKLVGRIGDTPIMGAGFWAEEWKPSGWFRNFWSNFTKQSPTTAVGVSGTGDGDVSFFLCFGQRSLIWHQSTLLDTLSQPQSPIVSVIYMNL